MKYSILFILHFPPPINGAAVVGRSIKESNIINGSFDATYINLTTSFELQAIGKGGLSKIVLFFKIAIKTIKHLILHKTDLCYMTLTAKGVGFYKDFMIVLILKAFRKKIIFHFHNKGVGENSRTVINRFLYRICFRNTKSILLTPLLYEDIAEFVQEEDVYYCPNGIPDNFKKNRSKRLQTNNTCKFLFLSNMMLEKGVLVLLKACNILKEKGLNFQCDFIGAWSDFTEEEFYSTVGAYHLSEYVFSHGKKYDQEKLKYFTDADVFVFPTYYNNETFGLVLLEAMQAELPAITTFEGGIPDVVSDGETAILVPQKDEIKLAEAMEKLANDFELRTEMGKAGRVRYEKLFTLAHFEKNLTTILNTVISE